MKFFSVSEASLTENFFMSKFILRPPKVWQDTAPNVSPKLGRTQPPVTPS